MRITVLNYGYSRVPVGGFLVLYQYANRLARRGHTVLALHVLATPEDLETAGATRVHDRRPPPDFWFPIDEKVAFEAIVAASHDDLPEADILFGSAVGKLSPPRTGIDVMMLQGFGFDEGADDLSQLDIPVGKVAAARWIYDLARQRGVPEQDLLLAPNAADSEVFWPERALEGRPARVAMLLNARLTIKGAWEGVAALERVHALRPEVQAVLFGSDPRPSFVPNWMEYRHLPTPTELRREIYGGSSVYLCPSRKDSFHLPAAEAMACGCALVSTDLGVTDYAVAGETALLSPRGAPEPLADSILRLMSDESLRHRLARAGLERVRRLSWERNADALELFMESRLRRGR